MPDTARSAIARHPTRPSRALVVVAMLAGIAGLVAPPFAARVVAATDAVRVLPSSPGSIRFSVEVPAPRLEPLGGDSRSVRLLLDGYESVSSPGQPSLPERVVTVAVPASGDVHIVAGGGASEVREDLRLALTPVTVRGSGLSETEAESRTEALALQGGRAAGNVGTSGVRARLLDVGWMRNQRVARIAVTPADYDPSARRLTLDRRIDVDVSVSGAEPGAAGAGLGLRTAEASDPFETLYRRTLVNYEQGRAWRRTAGMRRPTPAFARPGAGPMHVASVVPDTSVYAGRDWVKIAIDSTGFYKVDFAELRTLPLFGGSTTTPLDSLRLFTWPGFPVLPENSYCDSCDYREVAMGFVQVSANDILDDNREYLYFYAMGPSDWASLYDPGYPDTLFINHPYESRNYYYLTIAKDVLPVGGSPKRIATASGAVGVLTGTEVTPATFDYRIHSEVDAEYWPDPFPDPYPFKSNLFWEKWYWHTLAMGDGTFPVSVTAPGVDVTRPSRLRMRCWGVTDLVFKSNGIADHYLDVDFNALSFPRRAWEDEWAQTYDTTLVGLVTPTNTLSLRVPITIDPNAIFNAQRVDRTGLAWFDAFYARRFEPVADELEFSSPPGGGTVLYDLGPFSLAPASRPRVFDVTDPITPIEILGGTYASDGAGGYRLTLKRDETGLRRYRVIPDTRIKRVPNASVFMAPNSSLDNLRAAPGAGLAGADYLVIYYDGFQAAAESLAVWRRTRLPLHADPGPYQTAAIPISALYDQFSGGRTDPGAIRNFLRAAFFNWAEPPSFVTFLGDASYDFKDIRGLAPAGLPGTLLPSYEGGYDATVKRQFATDDWMLNVDDPVTVIPDFFGGRIPAGDAAGATGFVRDKLLAYERSAPLGEWRDHVMLVADDNEQGSSIDFLRWEHVRQTAVLDTQELPNHIDRAYVYLHTYPDGPNDTKPGAKADILSNINGEGVVLWNYIGHGSPFKIADESVFLDSDAGTLTNVSKPAVFVAASCDVGKYDDPSVQSLGERLVMNTGGGCVAVISATELAFSFQNAELNRVLYDSIFRRDTTATSYTYGQYQVGIGEALLEAKTGSTNNQKYQIMGDAGTRLDLPRLWVELTLRDAGGTVVDTLRRGEVVRFDGRILDRPGGTIIPFTGATSILIEDSAPIDTTFACAFCNREKYPFRAAPMFRGDARATNGTLSGQFVVPLDAVLGPRARLRGYANGSVPAVASTIDGVGSEPFTLIAGTPPTGDDTGPRIALSFAGGSTSVRPDAMLRIDLFDESGILITGHTVQNGIIVTVDDNSNTRVDITSSFRYTANSYQAGTASFRLPGLTPGPHSIKVGAADNLASGINAAQHRATASIAFEVSETPPLTVRRSFLFPNPTRSGGPGSGGQFVIDAPGDSVNVLLRLYTVTGRLIRTLKSFGGQGQIQIPWDGLDAEGDRLASGTYLYKVQVNTREEDGTSSARSRAVGEGRVVVLGR